MNIYLVILQRLRTYSKIKIHVEAKDPIDALNFAYNQLNFCSLNSKLKRSGNGWIVKHVNRCNCPNEAYNEFMGVKIWEVSPRHFLGLFPGEIYAKSFSSKSLNSVKKEIEGVLCTL